MAQRRVALRSGAAGCAQMALCESGSLASLLAAAARRGQAVPEALCWRALWQVAAGLDFLHGHGVLHLVRGVLQQVHGLGCWISQVGELGCGPCACTAPAEPGHCCDPDPSRPSDTYAVRSARPSRAGLNMASYVCCPPGHQAGQHLPGRRRHVPDRRLRPSRAAPAVGARPVALCLCTIRALLL